MVVVETRSVSSEEDVVFIDDLTTEDSGTKVVVEATVEDVSTEVGLTVCPFLSTVTVSYTYVTAMALLC